MSVLVKCDKCGKIDEAIKFVCIEVYKRINITSHDSICEECIDVCKECYKNILKTWQFQKKDI